MGVWTGSFQPVIAWTCLLQVALDQFERRAYGRADHQVRLARRPFPQFPGEGGTGRGLGAVGPSRLPGPLVDRFLHASTARALSDHAGTNRGSAHHYASTPLQRLPH